MILVTSGNPSHLSAVITQQPRVCGLTPDDQSLSSLLSSHSRLSPGQELAQRPGAGVITAARCEDCVSAETGPAIRDLHRVSSKMHFTLSLKQSEHHRLRLDQGPTKTTFYILDK